MMVALSLAGIAGQVVDQVELPHVAELRGDSIRIRPDLGGGERGHVLDLERTHLADRVRLRPAPLASGFVEAFGRSQCPDSWAEVQDVIVGYGGRLDCVGLGDPLFEVAAQVPLQADGSSDHVIPTVAIALALLRWVSPIYRSVAGLTQAANPRELLPADRDVEVWEIDPDDRDRSTNDHRRAENALIAWLGVNGLEAWDPGGPVLFDLAWRGHDGLLRVAEVKSSRSAVKQTRLGIGQLADYGLRLEEASGEAVRRVLCMSAAPEEAGFLSRICNSVGVVMTWPDNFDSQSAVLLGLIDPVRSPARTPE